MFILLLDLMHTPSVLSSIPRVNGRIYDKTSGHHHLASAYTFWHPSHILLQPRIPHVVLGSCTQLYLYIPTFVMSAEPGKINYMPLEQVEHDGNQHNQIRLLILLPGAEGDATRGHLKYAWRNSNPAYQALSYMWGTTEPSRAIFVDGISLLIRRNLWTALKSLRYEENLCHCR
jgi:hypothetical protein